MAGVALDESGAGDVSCITRSGNGVLVGRNLVTLDAGRKAITLHVMCDNMPKIAQRTEIGDIVTNKTNKSNNG